MNIIVYKTLQGGVRDVDWTTGKFSIYDVRTMRGKMTNLFGKDAFSKGAIEILNYRTLTKYAVRTKEELNSIEGKDF